MEKMRWDVLGVVADWVHLMVILNMTWKIWKAKSCTGISVKSLILFTLAWTLRYSDIFINFTSIYTTCMKATLILLSYTPLILILPFRKTYNYQFDSFRVEPLIICCLLFSFVINRHHGALQMLWTLSVGMESLAALPQFYMSSKLGGPVWMVRDYMFGLAIYRSLYTADWICQSYIHNNMDPVVFAMACFEMGLFWGFLCSFYADTTSAPSQDPCGYGEEKNGSTSQMFDASLVIETLADVIYAAGERAVFTLNELQKALRRRGVLVKNNQLKNYGYKNFKMLVEDQPWLVLYDKEGNWFVRGRRTGDIRPPRALVDANRRLTSINDQTGGKKCQPDEDTFVNPYDV